MTNIADTDLDLTGSRLEAHRTRASVLIRHGRFDAARRQLVDAGRIIGEAVEAINNGHASAELHDLAADYAVELVCLLVQAADGELESCGLLSDGHPSGLAVRP